MKRNKSSSAALEGSTHCTGCGRKFEPTDNYCGRCAIMRKGGFRCQRCATIIPKKVYTCPGCGDWVVDV